MIRIKHSGFNACWVVIFLLFGLMYSKNQCFCHFCYLIDLIKIIEEDISIDSVKCMDVFLLCEQSLWCTFLVDFFFFFKVGCDSEGIANMFQLVFCICGGCYVTPLDWNQEFRKSVPREWECVVFSHAGDILTHLL